jgi:hypothetical protein
LKHLFQFEFLKTFFTVAAGAPGTDGKPGASGADGKPGASGPPGREFLVAVVSAANYYAEEASVRGVYAD